MLGIQSLVPGSLFGQQPEQKPAVAPEGEAKSAPALRALMANIDTAEAELAQKREQFQKADTPEEKAAVSKEMDALRTKIDGLRADFASLAAGRDWAAVISRKTEKFNTAQELEQLLQPIVRELKDLTAKPRELDSLQFTVSDLTKREAEVKAATDHLATLVESLPEGALKTRLLALRADWSKQLDVIRNDLAVAQFQLDERLATKRTVFGAFRDLTADFFRSRGRNLLLAVFSFIAVFVLLRLVRWYVLRFQGVRSRFRRSFTIRLLDILYYVVCVVGATAALFLVLYASGDWVLLGVAILFLAGLAWASKTVLPGFYEQAKLLLNLGPVREGERVVFNGVPWEVQTINLYTELVNPAFEGARIRLPLRDLLTMNSRPTEDSLPWFPCRKNDWVRLSDGTRGKVVELTPEWVRLVLLGGSRKTYTVPAFLDLHPESLSHNFRVRSRFGIDYAHQAEATRRIPEVMQKAVEAGLLTLIDHSDLKNLSVDFCEAGSSSLDYLVLADFSGNVAPRAEQLERAIQRFLVDAANENKWVIPFPQLTLHQVS
jgi:small-conductance mechanosensitive channel